MIVEGTLFDINEQVKDMYRQRDSLQIELEKIENEKRLNSQRYQMEQQRINNELIIKLEKINNQVNYRYMQNTIPQIYPMHRPLLTQRFQIFQDWSIQAPNKNLNIMSHQQQQFNTNSDGSKDFIKLIYDHAKQALKQLSVKAFLTPEEQYYYSELKDALDFIEAGQTLRNPNKSFISKLDAAQKIEVILRKHFPQIMTAMY